MPVQHEHAASPKLSRRRFLAWVGLTSAAALAACEGRAAPATPAATAPPAASAAPAKSLTPSAAARPSATPALRPSPTVTATNSPLTPTPALRARVALGQAENYAAARLRNQLQTMFDSLGGLADLVRPGSRVGIKVNLTGGTWWDAPDKPPATETFATHPAVVGALCELLVDAGAGKLYIVDGAADESCWGKWGYTAMAKPLAAQLVNLCQPAPYSGFADFAVGARAAIYQSFALNGRLRDVDVFISVAKLKVHSVMGVTLGLKNLVGLTPLAVYKLRPADTARSALHGPAGYDTRLPRVIMDLNLARPVHLAVIDGIFSCEGGAGPWDKSLAQVKPGVLVASRDVVAADAVGTALMGYDPEAPSRAAPFGHTDNYLALAHALSLGTHRLNEIDVVGGSLETLRRSFKPAG
jgi:uncharacterized protein (DUF362 family)